LPRGVSINSFASTSRRRDRKRERRHGMHWAAAHPVMTVTQSELGLRVSGSRAQLPRALNRLPESLIAMLENTVRRKRSRRIDVRKYYVRKLVKEKLIKLIPCGTKEMIADAFTRSLTYPSCRTHKKTMLDATSQQEMLETTSLRASACWTWT